MTKRELGLTQANEPAASQAAIAPGKVTGTCRRLHRMVAHVPWIAWVLVLICAIFAMIDSRAFMTAANARNIALDTSILLVLAVGATFVLVAGGIDLSVGSVLVFSNVVAARLLRDLAMDDTLGALVALGVSLGCGAAWGLLNGVIIAYGRVNALITTLGTMGMALGASFVLSDNGLDMPVQNVRLSEIGIGRLFNEIPYLVIISGVAALVGGVVLAQTTFGRHAAGIGSNREAAERVGVNARRHLVKIYCLAATLSGLAGFMSLARYSTTTINGHNLDILAVVTGVILGGTSLFGGVGTMLGTVIGMFIPSVLNNGLVIIGVVPFWQQIAVGAILIAAVFIDQSRRNLRE